MRVVLCHHCWTWVFPNGVQCPECKRAIALDEPDPSAEELGQRLGTATQCLGDVIWERPKLPTHGEFWGTTAGLLYWPLLTHQPNGSIVPPEISSRSTSWSLLSLWRRSDDAHLDRLPREEFAMLPTAGEPLGQSFLDTPGAAFLPREHLVKITCRGRTWHIHRTVGRALRFTVPVAVPSGKPAWRAFFQQDAWRNISVVS